MSESNSASSSTKAQHPELGRVVNSHDWWACQVHIKSSLSVSDVNRQILMYLRSTWTTSGISGVEGRGGEEGVRCFKLVRDLAFLAFRFQ